MIEGYDLPRPRRLGGFSAFVCAFAVIALSALSGICSGANEGSAYISKTRTRQSHDCETLQKLCDADNPASCFELGKALLGVGATCVGGLDVGIAERSLLAACRGGLANACLALGSFYLEETYDRVDRGAATEAYEAGGALLRRECEQGRPRSCATLSRTIEAGLIGTSSARDAIFYFERASSIFGEACDAGDVAACVSLAALYDNFDRVPKEPRRNHSSERLRALTKGCNLGSYVSCQEAGDILHHGRDGVGQDSRRAIDLFDRGCGFGFYASCIALGTLYESDAPDLRDLARAVASYEKACHAGDCHGCRSAASMYESGRGAPMDAVRAAALRATECVDRRQR
jgi:hypothetical protein